MNNAELICKNLKDEAEAIEGYLPLLETLTDPDDISVIKEIISEEKKHAILLQAMLFKYDGDILMEKPDDALEFMKTKIK